MNIEAKITRKSGILEWSKENLENVTNNSGLFVLKDSPISGNVLYVGTSEHLRDELLGLYSSEMGKVPFFEWYETQSKIDAETLKKTWEESQIL